MVDHIVTSNQIYLLDAATAGSTSGPGVSQTMTRLKLAVKVLSIFVLLEGLATAGEPKKIRMAVATFSQSVLPMVVAREKDYFREEDLDVELILMTASLANMALLGGSVDFISSGPSVVGAIARGAPLKFVFICFNRPMQWLYAKPEIKDLSGLKEKRSVSARSDRAATFSFKRS